MTEKDGIDKYKMSLIWQFYHLKVASESHNFQINSQPGMCKELLVTECKCLKLSRDRTAARYSI